VRELVTHHGGCHCGNVRFEVDAPAVLAVDECNCSVCTKSGFLHLIVQRDQFRLVSGEHDLVNYRFNTGIAQHLFCGVCGIKSYYVPRSHPDGISVNVRCLDDGTVAGISVNPCDGKNWETQFPAGRSDTYGNAR
jgi:hypothetical protein